mmetsp:Transcript_35703/g.78234  ORF Transcript_35703/g.78234 Transcript_35703/m.78234 type:complete len:323 (+) Transcript_35703:36-1004(+)
MKITVATTFIAYLLFVAGANAFVSRPTRSSLTSLWRGLRPSAVSRSDLGMAGNNYQHALIFDCDGVIIETEELHRLAYNAAFKAADLSIDGKPVDWSVEYYDVLQNTVGGGIPKMLYHFRTTMGGKFPTQESGTKAAPETEEEEQALVESLQKHKTELYKEFVSEKAVPRPGVIELMDEALEDPRIAVGVCSASTKAAVTKVLDVVLGEERRQKLDVCILGDDVSKLKPDPMIYVAAAEKLGIEPNKCVVVEDSMVGLRAAKGACMKCLITYTSSTASEDFYGEGADAKVPELEAAGVNLDMIFGPMREKGAEADILVGVKD